MPFGNWEDQPEEAEGKMERGGPQMRGSWAH